VTEPRIARAYRVITRQDPIGALEYSTYRIVSSSVPPV
jgi:hypothetical protein